MVQGCAGRCLGGLSGPAECCCRRLPNVVVSGAPADANGNGMRPAAGSLKKLQQLGLCDVWSYDCSAIRIVAKQGSCRCANVCAS